MQGSHTLLGEGREGESLHLGMEKDLEMFKSTLL